MRTIIGLRSDIYWMDVHNVAGGNSGDVAAQVLSPKLNLIFGPWDQTEFYLDYGQGFHSNDARGVVAAADPATPLPRSTGAEAGVRTAIIPGLKSELSVWLLDLQSELVWDGDAGTMCPAVPPAAMASNWPTGTRPSNG